jgi:flagellar biosynthesis protein FlhA
MFEKLRTKISEKKNVPKKNQENALLEENPDPIKLYEKLGVDTISIQIGGDLIPIFDSKKTMLVYNKLHELRLRLIKRLGFVLPSIRFMDSYLLSRSTYSIFVRSIPVGTGEINCYQPGSFSKLDPNMKRPISGKSQYEYQEDNPDLKKFDLELQKHQIDLLMQHIEQCAIENVHNILNRYVTLQYMAKVRQEDKSLIEDFPFSVADIQHILASLLREEVSIKDIMFVLEQMNFHAHNTYNLDITIERIRLDLSENICHAFRNKHKELESIVVKSKKNWIDQEEEFTQLIETITSKQNLFQLNRPCVICTSHIRFRLFQTLSRHIPNIIVLSYDEITPDTKIVVLDEL